MFIRRVLPALCAVGTLLLSATYVMSQSQQPDNTPIKPMIPDVDRNDPDRVFLERADELRATSYVDYQILVGNVEFRRGGMFMYCDSAHYYDRTGSFEAFGNVRMRQGDTLFIDADELVYNDSLQLATLYADRFKKVTLRNRDVTLTTDIFNYDLGIDLGYYDVSGTLTDKQNKLTSLEGEYNPTTKDANFRFNVHLTSRSEKDTLEIFSEALQYNTASHIAELTEKSVVKNADGTILTTNGIYNTETTQADLYDRSTVIGKNGTTLTGDTLFYNRQTGFGEAFGNIEINDSVNKMMMFGQYGFYNELTDSIFITGRAKAVEYSSPDSLYLHGDTIRAFRIINSTVVEIPDTTAIAEVQTIPSDSTTVDSISASVPMRKMIDAELFDTVRYVVAAPRVKFYRRDIQGLCDSMTFVSTDSMVYMNRFPVVWSDNRQVTGNLITLHLNDSTVEWAKVIQNAFMAEFIEEGYFNQLSGKEMLAGFENGRLRSLDVSGNVIAITFPEESDSTINKMMNIESSFLKAYFKDNTLERMKLWSETKATVTPLYLSKKSMLYLSQFQWYDKLRPTSPDDIFIFPDELIELFKTAPTATSDKQAKPAITKSVPIQEIPLEPEDTAPSQQNEPTDDQSKTDTDEKPNDDVGESSRSDEISRQ